MHLLSGARHEFAVLERRWSGGYLTKLRDFAMGVNRTVPNRQPDATSHAFF